MATILVVVTLSLAAGYRIVRRGSRYAAVSFRVILFGIAIPIQAIIIPPVSYTHLLLDTFGVHQGQLPAVQLLILVDC